MFFFSAVDVTDPVIDNCLDIAERVNAPSVGVIVDYDEPTATDESGIVSLSSRSHSPGTFFPVGQTTVTYIFVDGAGNTATCVFTVTVIRGEPYCYFVILLCRTSATTQFAVFLLMR